MYIKIIHFLVFFNVSAAVYADLGNEYLGDFEYKDWYLEGFYNGTTKQTNCVASSVDSKGASSLNINWFSDALNHEAIYINYQESEARHEPLIIGGMNLLLQFDNGVTVAAQSREEHRDQGVFINIYPDQDIIPLLAKSNLLSLIEPDMGVITTLSLSGFTATYRKIVELCGAPIARLTQTDHGATVIPEDVYGILREFYGTNGPGTEPVIQFQDFSCDNSNDALATVHYLDDPDGPRLDTFLVTKQNGELVYDNYSFSADKKNAYSLCSLANARASFITPLSKAEIKNLTGLDRVCGNGVKIEDGLCDSVYIFWSEKPLRNRNLVLYQRN